jgi:hypothetical protein
MDHHLIWRFERHAEVVECLMVSCCAGAELQVWRGEAIVVRELYPMKSDLYERAARLRDEFEWVASRGGPS